MTTKNKSHPQSATQKRLAILHQLESRLEVPMLVLSFAWLVLMILEFTSTLSPFLINLNHGIWVIFIIDFAIKLTLAPSKLNYIKHNWVTAIALVLPAFRILRIFRAVKIFRATGALRSIRLARVLTSLNRGISALGKSLGRRGFGYVLGLTLIVTLAGAAGILSFEKENGAIQDYGTAVWWTAMILTTMGTDYFPHSSEGRLLCLLLAIYGFAVFGYVTAAVATFFVDREAQSSQSEIVGQKDIRALINEVALLREELSKQKIKTEPVERLESSARDHNA